LIERGRIVTRRQTNWFICVMNAVKETIKVTQSSVPICCPPKDEDVTSLHPRVYIKMGDEQGPGNPTGKCPYCGNQFEMTG